ncbi:MAG: helix-turn-helix domain-containing protein [Sphingorhabdus sp.]
MKLGAAIREQRKTIPMSQEALADAAGIERSHMGKIERGERNVSFLNIARIADALNMPVASLIASAGL